MSKKNIHCVVDKESEALEAKVEDDQQVQEDRRNCSLAELINPLVRGDLFSDEVYTTMKGK